MWLGERVRWSLCGGSLAGGVGGSIGFLCARFFFTQSGCSVIFMGVETGEGAPVASRAVVEHEEERFSISVCGRVKEHGTRAIKRIDHFNRVVCFSYSWCQQLRLFVKQVNLR
jgi:hypothetical protein